MTSFYSKVNYVIFLLLFLVLINISRGQDLKQSSFNNSSQLLWIFLSERKVEQEKKLNYPSETKNRLKKSNWTRNNTDFEISDQIISQISQKVDSLRHTSRALRAISISATYSQYKEVLQLPFVKNVNPIATYVDKTPTSQQKSLRKATNPPDFYGSSYTQLDQIGIPGLHKEGLTGKEVRIALLDAGFDKSHRVFDKILEEDRLIAERDFIFDDQNVTNQNKEDSIYNQDSHGTSVWSLAGGYNPDTLIGGAYQSEFVLAKTERIQYERRIEEDNFVAAVEWADSLGVDIISASLGYREFNNFEYSYADLDGETATTTKVINWAHDRGIVCVISAGNEDEGIVTDGGLTTPADAPGAISVGAVNSIGELEDFSSHGPTADGRIKPDLCAQGRYNFVASNYGGGGYGRGGGTSFSAPLVAAGCALLLENFPDWNPDKLLQQLKNYASNSNNPNDTTGWGIPDFYTTYQKNVDRFKPAEPLTDKQKVLSFPNPVSQNSTIYFKNVNQAKGRLIIYNILGQKVFAKSIQGSSPQWSLINNNGVPVSQGIYLVHIKSENLPDKFGKVTVLR